MIHWRTMLGFHGLYPYHIYSSATSITQGAAYHYSLEHRSGYREVLPRGYGMRWRHATPLLLAIEFLRLFVQRGALLDRDKTFDSQGLARLRHCRGPLANAARVALLCRGAGLATHDLATGVLLEIRFRQPRLRLGLGAPKHGTLRTLAFRDDALLHGPTAHALHRCPHRFRHDVSKKGAVSNHDCVNGGMCQ